MITDDKIPEHAITTKFYCNGTTHTYQMWPLKQVGQVVAWVWRAGGNEGISSSQEGAGSAARRWLKDGIKAGL